MTPSWVLDIDRLRTCLDDLRGVVRRAGEVRTDPIAALLIHDRRRVAESLRSLVAGLARADLDARAALSSVMVAIAVRAADSVEIRETLNALRRGWRARVASRLTPAKVGVLRRFLAHPGPDLLAIFGKTADENAHSDVIRWLLDPRCAPRIAPAALVALAERLHDGPGWKAALTQAVGARCLAVHREYVLDAASRIDLLVTGPGFVLAIENKVGAAEHHAQTEAYWRWLESRHSRHAAIFLTPEGAPAASVGFVPVSYLDMLSCLLAGPAEGDVSVAEREVLAGYVKSLASSILRTELRAVRAPEESDEHELE